MLNPYAYPYCPNEPVDLLVFLFVFIDKQTIAEFLFWFNRLLYFMQNIKWVFDVVLIGILEAITGV